MKTYDISVRIIFEYDCNRPWKVKRTKKIEKEYHLFPTKKLNRKTLRKKIVEEFINYIFTTYKNACILNVISIDIGSKPTQAYMYVKKNVFTLKENNEIWVDLPELEEVNLTKYKKEKKGE